jgi:hypothetical protein
MVAESSAVCAGRSQLLSKKLSRTKRADKKTCSDQQRQATKAAVFDFSWTGFGLSWWFSALLDLSNEVASRAARELEERSLSFDKEAMSR